MKLHCHYRPPPDRRDSEVLCPLMLMLRMALALRRHLGPPKSPLQSDALALQAPTSLSELAANGLGPERLQSQKAERARTKEAPTCHDRRMGRLLLQACR